MEQPPTCDQIQLKSARCHEVGALYLCLAVLKEQSRTLRLMDSIVERDEEVFEIQRCGAPEISLAGLVLDGFVPIWVSLAWLVEEKTGPLGLSM